MSTYVCSDIHGRYDRYLKLFNYVKDTDTLYILGDCIDRHDGGIDILKDIMKRKNIKMIRGNHEDMMIKSQYDREWFDIWNLPNNGGSVTYNKFISLLKNEREEIENFLKSLPIFYRIKVGENSFYLGHASIAPESEYPMEVLYEEDVNNEYVINFLVWESPFKHPMLLPKQEDNKYNILGHVYVQHFNKFGKIEKFGNTFDIDGGCALPKDEDDHTNLILLRLDDFKDIYIK
jgi:serine/threonine protein phosphatase 1